MARTIKSMTSKYDKPAVSQAIIDGMMFDNLSLRKSCVKAGVPACTFLEWVEADAELAKQYARARESLIDNMAEELQDIADEPVGTTNLGATDSGAVQKQRLQVDTRKWLLSKLAPRKYGDKVEVDHTGDVTINQITRRIVDPNQ